MKIVIGVEQAVVAGIEHVRSEAGLTATSTIQDPFDEGAQFVLAREATSRTLLGVVRVANDRSSLWHWSSGGSQLPYRAGMVELSRGAVLPSFRGLNIYRAMMLRAMCFATERGDLATAAVSPQFRQLSFLHRLGFLTAGEAFDLCDPFVLGSIPLRLIPITCTLSRDRIPQWNTMMEEAERGAARQGVTLIHE